MANIFSGLCVHSLGQIGIYNFMESKSFHLQQQNELRRRDQFGSASTPHSKQVDPIISVQKQDTKHHCTIHINELTWELWKGHSCFSGKEASSIRIGKTSEIPRQREINPLTNWIYWILINQPKRVNGSLPREQWWLTSSKLGFSNWKHEQLTGRLLFLSIIPGK